MHLLFYSHFTPFNYILLSFIYSRTFVLLNIVLLSKEIIFFELHRLTPLILNLILWLLYALHKNLYLCVCFLATSFKFYYSFFAIQTYTRRFFNYIRVGVLLCVEIMSEVLSKVYHYLNVIIFNCKYVMWFLFFYEIT